MLFYSFVTHPTTRTIKKLLFLATDSSQIHNDSALIAYYLDAAYNINQSISPMLVVEANKKAINGIYISKFVRRDYNLSLNEKNTVDTIAPKCPYSEGPAVIEARVMQRHWNDSMIYDNDYICDQILPKLKTNKSNDEVIEIAAYPNPANNIITLKSNIAGTMVITDVTGRKLISQRITIPLTSIKVEKLVPGIYNISVYTDDKVVSSVQVIKIQ